MKYRTIQLSETEMALILETLNKTAYLGQHSDTVSAVRRKMDIEQEPEKPGDIAKVSSIDQTPKEQK